MTLSPRGSSAVPNGSIGKATSMMLVAGVLAWITGRWWVAEATTAGWLLQVAVSVAALAALTVPCQLIGGRATPPSLLAVVGAVGFTVPWWLSVALSPAREDVPLTTIVLLALSLAVVLAVCWATRWSTARWGD